MLHNVNPAFNIIIEDVDAIEVSAKEEIDSSVRCGDKNVS